MIIGTEGSAGSLKFDCLTKIGAQLHSLLSSDGIAFCKFDCNGRAVSDKCVYDLTDYFILDRLNFI